MRFVSAFKRASTASRRGLFGVLAEKFHAGVPSTLNVAPLQEQVGSGKLLCADGGGDQASISGLSRPDRLITSSTFSEGTIPRRKEPVRRTHGSPCKTA